MNIGVSCKLARTACVDSLHLDQRDQLLRKDQCYNRYDSTEFLCFQNLCVNVLPHSFKFMQFDIGSFHESLMDVFSFTQQCLFHLINIYMWFRCIETGGTEVDDTVEEADIEVNVTCEWVGVELASDYEIVFDSNEGVDLRDLAGSLIVNFGGIGVVPTGIATDALDCFGNVCQIFQAIPVVLKSCINIKRIKSLFGYETMVSYLMWNKFIYIEQKGSCFS
ncbi:hypothetical protein PHYBLDRAFT_69573 [Phycomyces blakesleeanus NRRL 1555(-)]|uniref:Uncharacterized protein n=1 Tax=Phycomyces blakesleeanus (strain ATCC 8743b / DSM 1359 / FGSC 10004 / NBRC 33097 / NRRL 1555) TaxID=763407 RepID=A0A163DDW9_PHYB8|nr:hypothetical protein PHYBLDRAFT_69573 [Phycomyces blakesleeanus NRRL 1555(-)]OAD70590.1 hypothetical protein PHYBLDRAFT_69573 [Phycomyces blakesleeanus NRRL 1555(-)]|eukprot:XP_018288630.1 hypothetical protein PHYBLDRAFT_69573 [Phycomyces blakesleeanus NRRL 1555(-)]